MTHRNPLVYNRLGKKFPCKTKIVTIGLTYGKSYRGTTEPAVESLSKGGVVAFTLGDGYRVGVDAHHQEAMARLIQAKQIVRVKPMTHLFTDPHVGPKLAKFTPKAERIASFFWPGPVTLVLERTDDPKCRTVSLSEKDQRKIGLRMPEDALATDLIKRSGISAIVTSSLNLLNNHEAVREQLYEFLYGNVEVLIRGGEAIPDSRSTVLDLTGVVPRILKLGRISREQLEAVLEEKVEVVEQRRRRTDNHQKDHSQTHQSMYPHRDDPKPKDHEPKKHEPKDHQPTDHSQKEHQSTDHPHKKPRILHRIISKLRSTIPLSLF
jgi:tRNA threonylcarbamoyl adenosine modification protein (Sua5/YciO/YrdC/YwlC family)